MGWGNSVHRFQGATVIAVQQLPCPDDGSWPGCSVRVTLSKGRASSGYRSNYDRRPVWWLELDLVNQIGNDVWHQGTRFGGPHGETRAREEYRLAVTDERPEEATS